MKPSTVPLADAWTGGQYSAVRIAAAGTMGLGFLGAAVRAGKVDTTFLLLAAACAALAAGVGRGERILAAVVALFVSLGGSEALALAAAQYLGFWLSLHLLLPLAPYGSLAARRRQDPAGPWRMPAWQPASCLALFVLARLFSTLHALYDGHAVLAGLFFFTAMLVIQRSTALAGWALSLGLGLALAAMERGSFGAAWFLHLLTFQPAWIAANRSTAPRTVFYDGSCALCHGLVRFLLAEDDRDVPHLRIAPIGGQAFAARFPGAAARALPDSVVVVSGGEVLLRSAAVTAILEDLGGWWAAIAAGIGLLPRAAADAAYDAVAARRYRWFGRKADACPVLTPQLRNRLEA